MKQICGLVVSIFIISGLFAQGDEDGKNFLSRLKAQLVPQIHYCGWTNVPDSVTRKWYSRGVNMYVELDLPFGHSNFGLRPGVGFGIDNVYSNSLLNLDTAGIVHFQPLEPATYENVKTNKLMTQYADGKLELYFRTKPNEKNYSFKLGLGMKVGLLLEAFEKYKGPGNLYGVNEDVIKYKYYQLPNLSSVRYGPTFRIGYAFLDLFGYYSLSTLFEPTKGPEINTFNIGVSFNIR